MAAPTDFDIGPGQVVLAWHQGNLFEAKVLEAVSPDEFKVHYKGWGEKWNETVHKSRILPDNDLNRQLQRDTKRQAKTKGPERGPRSAKIVEDGQLPESLQQRLADDWERVSLRRYLVRIPIPPSQRSVSDILSEFQTAHPDQADIADDLFHLFNISLSVHLLYQIERKQFSEAWAKCAASKKANPQDQLIAAVSGPRLSERRGGNHADTLADLYGVEHLLRLLVKMPRLLWDVKEDESVRASAAAVITALGNFIEALQFSPSQTDDAPKTVWSSYEPAPAQVVRELEQQRSK